MKNKSFLNESAPINNFMFSIMMMIMTVVIIYLTPLSNNGIKFFVALILGLVVSALGNMVISLSIRLRKAEIHDSLTGLYNSNFLSECKYRMISTTDRQQAKLGLMTISIEKLNDLENLFGSKSRDAIIRYVGEGISFTSRATEFIFRIQEDNFLIFFADINEYSNIKTIKNRMNTYFEKPFIFDSKEIYIKLLFGYAVYPDDGENFDSVLSVANQRMYVEKSRTN